MIPLNNLEINMFWHIGILFSYLFSKESNIIRLNFFKLKEIQKLSEMAVEDANLRISTKCEVALAIGYIRLIGSAKKR